MSLYRQPGMLMFWTHSPVAPWQTSEWVDQMRQQLRRAAFIRMIENRFVTSESDFIDMDWWDTCVDENVNPIVVDTMLPVWLGVDASVKKDSTAIVACTWDQTAKKVRLVWHRVFQPSKEDPLDFERTIEAVLLDLKTKFHLRKVLYDPYQMISSAQRLTKAGVPMVEFAQSVPNLLSASQNLYDLVKGRNLIVYPDDDIRLAVSRCVAIESSRGWRIAKDKTSHRIDVVIALAQAALGAVQGAASMERAPMVIIGKSSQPLPSDLFRSQRPHMDDGQAQFCAEIREHRLAPLDQGGSGKWND